MVVLPLPLAPRSEVNAPSRIDRLSEASTPTAPKLLPISRSSIIVAMASPAQIDHHGHRHQDHELDGGEGGQRAEISRVIHRQHGGADDFRSRSEQERGGRILFEEVDEIDGEAGEQRSLHQRRRYVLDRPPPAGAGYPRGAL